MPAGGNSRFRGYPARMSERQQLALLLQMTSEEIVSTGGNRSESVANQSTSRSSSLSHHRGAKGRWSAKNGESPTYRKEDYRNRSMIFDGYEQIGKESHEATGANPSIETTSAPDSPRSPSSETGTSAPPIVQQNQPRDIQNYQHKVNYQYQQGQIGTDRDAEDCGDLCEMRRTPPQNKVDRSGTGQPGSSPRVTLRLNQVRGSRDDKKTAGSGSRQSISAPTPPQMDSPAKSTPSTTPASSSSSTPPTTTSGGSTPSNTAPGPGGAPPVDTTDVYEFKSSKEATPVRGSSSSPNPNPEKEKEASKTSSGANQPPETQVASSGESTTPAASSGSAGTVETQATGSPCAKRVFEGDEDQDEENRRKKRKESEVKDAKGPGAGRQGTGRTAGANDKSDKVASSVTPPTFVEQCAKPGKPTPPSSKPPSTPSDRKSPNTLSVASSPKPSTPGVPSKTGESDSEEDRPKSSDSGSAPKVPPLKIVIPQTTEQEQGTRNGKNPSTRGHQLPYVVASSNSNDSTDKDQNQSASGTTSPTEPPTAPKPEEKKDFSGAIEERSTHHQRVLRSSHRTGNGGNGSGNSKDSNQSYSNSSPLPATSLADRSNNSSPQQRHNSPGPENTSSEPAKTSPADPTPSNASSKTSSGDKAEKNDGGAGKSGKESSETSEGSSGGSNTTTSVSTAAPVELHPRKRKMKPSKEAQQTTASNESNEAANAGTEVHPHDQPITNCYQLFLNIRKQIERRRKGLFPVQPKPPQGFKDYLMNRCTYVLAGNANKEPNVNPPGSLQGPMKELYVEQEKERYRLRMQHVVEKEKLVLSVEQEILRVHGRAARALANQILPFSVCTILKDEEVYNVITPEQEEKDRNQRSRYNGRLFLSWLQDVDDKWEKIKEAMLLRHHNEAESLHAVQRMDWEWKLKEVGLCEFKATPQIDDLHVPIVHVSDDFDLLPA